MKHEDVKSPCTKHVNKYEFYFIYTNYGKITDSDILNNIDKIKKRIRSRYTH